MPKRIDESAYLITIFHPLSLTKVSGAWFWLKGDLEKQLDEAKTITTRLLKENQQLKTNLLNKQAREQNQKIEFDDINKTLKKVREELTRASGKSIQDLCTVIRAETDQFTQFVKFVNDEFLSESQELPCFIAKLNERSFKALQQFFFCYTTNLENDEKLHQLQVVIGPNYEALRIEKIKQEAIKYSVQGNDVENVSFHNVYVVLFC